MDPHPSGAFPRNWFDSNGNMLHEGRIKFWHHIDSSLRKFNIEKVSLDPHERNQASSRGGIPHVLIWPPHRHAGDERQLPRPSQVYYK